MEEQEREKTILTVVKDGEETKKEINKPTDEEKAQFKDDFEKAMEDFKNTKWDISEKGAFGANDVAMFLYDFMKRFAFWTKTGWMGMIKMNEELRKAQALAATEENTALALDYQALEFCAYMLSNPGSVGIDAANDFEKIADKFSKIGIVVGQKVEEARARLKDIQYLQEKWAAAEQGFFLSDLEPPKQDEEVPQVEGNTLEVDVAKESGLLDPDINSQL
jgi:hypothetical protein